MSGIYKRAVFCILVLCFYTNIGKAQSNIARRLEILEQKFAIQVYENALMREELNSMKLRLSELENGTIVKDEKMSMESTDIKCCTDNEKKTLLENTAAWQQRDQQMASLRKGIRAEKQVREESAVSFQNKLVDLNTELETLKSYIKQNVEDTALLKRVTTNEKSLQEISATSKEFNQTVHGDVLLKIQTMEHSFGGLQGDITKTIHLIEQSLKSIKDLAQQGITKLTNYQLNQHVAFSASLSQSVPNLNPGATLKLGHVIYNAGNGYSRDTGIFTTPRNGVYVFFAHFQGDRSLSMSLQKNGASLLGLYGHGADSNMVVLDLQQGDRVNVVIDGFRGLYYVQATSTTFSGYILYPL